MKHLRPYQVFESQNVVMAGIKNTLKYNNMELYGQLIEQHSDMIDYYKLVEIITAQYQKYLYLLENVPKHYFSEFELKMLSLDKLLKTQNKFKTEIGPLQSFDGGRNIFVNYYGDDTKFEKFLQGWMDSEEWIMKNPKEVYKSVDSYSDMKYWWTMVVEIQDID